LISVIVPVLNESEQIESVLQQLQVFRQAGHEVILIDGGSTDHTVALAQPYVDVLIESERGRASQMNAGAEIALGDLLLFQHVDTRLPPDALEQLDGLQGKSLWGRFDVRLSSGHWMFPVIAQMMNWRSRLTGIATGDQSIFVSRDLFKKIGGIPPQPLMEDIALSTCLKKIVAPVCLKAAVTTSSRRWQKKGVWRTIFLMWAMRLAYAFGVSAHYLADIYYPSNRSR